MFMIIGVLILVSIALVLYLRQGEKNQENVQQVQDASFLGGAVQDYVQSCVEKTGKEAITFVAEHGGYYHLPETVNFSLPYYFYNNENLMISRTELEQQISAYVNEELFFCVRNFAALKEYGYEISEGEINTSVRLGKEKVNVEVIFPITVTQGAIMKELVFFSAAVPSRIGTIYDAVFEWMKTQENEPDRICVSCLVRMAQEHELQIEMLPVDENTIFIIHEKKEQFVPEEYQFVNKYEFTE